MDRLFKSMADIGNILDVGSQYSPYTPFFLQKCRLYTCIDVVKTPLVHVVCNAECMPLDHCSYDLILCTQVLEHTSCPQKIIDECYRVLRPGGILLVTVPSVFPQHGYPSDNWRFMPQGLELLLNRFARVEVIGEMDFAESWVSANLWYLHCLTCKCGRLQPPINAILAFCGNVLARLLSSSLRPFTKNNFGAFSMNLWATAYK